jgi:hypothetical protein
VELGFINALVEMFEEEEILEENTAERIKQDLALAARPLRDTRGFSSNLDSKKCGTCFLCFVSRFLPGSRMTQNGLQSGKRNLRDIMF